MSAIDRLARAASLRVLSRAAMARAALVSLPTFYGWLRAAKGNTRVPRQPGRVPPTDEQADAVVAAVRAKMTEVGKAIGFTV